MTDLLVTEFGDAWLNNAAGRRGQNYGGVKVVRVQQGERRGALLSELPNIAGRTVLDAFLVGHAAEALAAQDLTVAPFTSRWQPGRITWNNQPGVLSASAVTASIGATPAGGEVVIPGLDLILQAVADGADWYGLRLSTNSSTSQTFRSMESGEPAWELHIVLSDVPDTPTNLRPDGGGDVDADWDVVLAWDPIDDQAKSWVQVDTPTGGADPDDESPDYDSELQDNVDPQWALAGEHTLSGAGPHYWRVGGEDADGNEIPFSDWAEFGVGNMPELVVDSPTGPFGDSSFTAAAHLSSGEPKAWQAMVTRESKADVRAETTLQNSSTIEWQVPARIEAGGPVLHRAEGGWLQFKVWPEGDWAVAVGHTPYRMTWVELVFTGSESVDPPTDLTVDQYARGDSRLVWTWQRTEAATAWFLLVDGEEVARLEPEDVEADAGTYTYVDDGLVSPLQPHTLAVLAVEDGEVSTPAEQTDHVHEVEGVWLLPFDGDPIRLSGTAVGDFVNIDRRARYETLVGPPVDIIYDPNPGRTGVFSGNVHSAQPENVWTTLRRIEALKLSRRRRARLVWGSQSIVVRVLDPDGTSSQDILPSNAMHNVRFEFVEDR